MFALDRHIGVTALAASPASRSRPQSTMLTIIADQAQCCLLVVGYCSPVTPNDWRWLSAITEAQRSP